MAHTHISEPSIEDRLRETGSSEVSADRIEQQPTAKRERGFMIPATLTALFLFLQMFDYHALGMSAVTPDRIIFLILIVGIVSALLKGQVRISKSGLEWCMLAFAILCIISYIVTNPDAGTGRYKWLATLFNLIVSPFGIYLIAKNGRYNFKNTLWLLKAIVCIGVYLAFTAAFEHFHINALVFPKYIIDPRVGIQFGRARGPMVGSNPMGEWLVFVYLATCLVMPYSRTIVKYLLYGLLMLLVIGVYFTLTRGVWVSFAIAAVLSATLGGKFGKQSRIILLLVFAAFFSGVGSKFSLGGETLFSRRQNTIDYRLSNNKTTFNMGMANFFTGVGYGNFKSNWAKYFGSDARELTKDLTDGNHNTYLGLFADLGFPGVALYVTLFGFVLRECIRSRKLLNRDLHFERGVALSALAMVAITLWEGMSGDNRFNPTLNTITFLLVGITASMSRMALIARRKESKSPARGTSMNQKANQEE
jgi:O-antigen ligase